MNIFEIDKRIPNICCQGFNWDIIDVIPDPDVIATYWGKCENPNCPEGYYSAGDENSIWYGISIIEHDSIELVEIEPEKIAVKLKEKLTKEQIAKLISLLLEI